MKGKQVVLGHIGKTKVAALLVDGIVQDVLVEDLNRLPLGSLLRAVVDRPVKGILTVQTSGFAEEGKADPVTQRILFKSRYAIVTPDQPGLNISRQISSDDLRDALTLLAKSAMSGSDMGLIIRSAAAAADLEEIGEDIQTMRATAEAIAAERM